MTDNWTYDEVNGEIIDIYNWPSEITKIPLTDAEQAELSEGEALVKLLIADDQKGA